MTNSQKAKILISFMYAGNPNVSFAARANALGLTVMEARELIYQNDL